MITMGEEMVKFDAGQYPVLAGGAEQALTALRENLGGSQLTPFELDRAKIPAGGGTSFELEGLEGLVQEKELTGIVVYQNMNRAYWRDSFEDTGGGTPPDCSSRDGVTGVGDPGGECLRCPLNQFGSAPKGRGKACQERHLLFVLRPGEFLPLLVSAPPTSLKPVRQYLMRLTSKGVPFFDVVTSISLGRDKNTDGISYSKLSATMAGRVPEEHRAALAEYRRAITPALEQVVLEPEEFQEGAEA